MKTRILLLIVLVTSFSLITVLSAQGQKQVSGTYLNWSGAWQFGTSEAVATDTARSLAYLSSGGAVLIVDTSDPESPLLVNNSIRTTGQVLDIHMDYENMNLLLACDEAGMEIWDVDEVSNPTRLSTIEIMYGGVETPVRHVEQYGDFAVTENRWGYVHTVNISDPVNPFQVAFNGVMGNPAHDISVSGDGYIHATGAQYFVLLAINPDGSLNVASQYYLNAGSVFGTEDASFMSVNGNLYIIDYNGGGSSSTPASFHDIVVRGDMAYLMGDDAFMIYDVSDLENPFQVGQTSIPGFPDQLDIMGDFAFIAYGYEGMKIVDISDPGMPVMVSQVEGTGVTWKTQVTGDYAYLANSVSGVSVIDISDPSGNGPKKVAGIESDDETRDLDIDNDVLYFADWTGGLRIFDIQDPENPIAMGSINNLNAWRVEAEGNNLFLISSNPNNPDTLLVYDITDPQIPVMESTMLLPNLSWRILYHEAHLYIGTYQDGLLIIDVSDPQNPSQAAQIDLPDVTDIDIENDVAYVASTDWEGGLVTIDISDPQNPQIINIYNPSGWYHPFHVAVENGVAYTSENFGELKMFDVSDPSNPQEMDSYVTSGSIVQMTARENYLYISDGPDGLQILTNDFTTGTEETFTDHPFHAYAHPNPFRESTAISVDLATRARISIMIYNSSGAEVNTLFKGSMDSGENTVRWDGTSNAGGILPNGLYIYQVRGSGINRSGKMVLQR